MKFTQTLILSVCILFFGLIASSCYEVSTSGTQSNMEAAARTATASATAITVPELSYFQERRTIAKWARTFDTPQITTYIYIFSFGNLIGYYVTDGKPASTNSYLTPEFRDEYMGNGGTKTHQLPDVDGCYGSNSPGIRFFTSSGIAVEVAGEGMGWVYSTQKLPGNFIELGR